MTINAANAFIIHVQACGETSCDLTLFTREKGIVRCRYKGARGRRRKAAVLQPFHLVWLAWSTTRYGHAYAQTIEPITPAFIFQKNHLFSALYINELIYYAVKEEDAHEALYDAYVHALEALQGAISQSSVEVILRQFERQLLLACGYELSFTNEWSGLALQDACYYKWTPGLGFEKADKGILGAHLRSIAHHHFEDATVLKIAKWVMRRAIHHLLDGKPIKTRQLYTIGHQHE